MKILIKYFAVSLILIACNNKNKSIGNDVTLNDSIHAVAHDSTSKQTSDNNIAVKAICITKEEKQQLL